MTTGSRVEGVRGIGSNGFIRTVANLTVAGDLVIAGALTFKDDRASTADLQSGAAAGTAPLRIQNTTDAASNLALSLGGGTRGTPANSDSVYMSFLLDNSTTAQVEASRIKTLWTTVTAGGERVDVVFDILRSGSLVESFRIDGSAQVVDFTYGTFHQSGARIGANSGDNEIDDATQGSASTTLYIGNASITVSSDVRVKDNIADFRGNALEMLGTIKVKEFHYTDHKPFGGYDGKTVGFTAQDMNRLAPWAVNTQGGADCLACIEGRECGTHQPWQARYEFLNGLLVKAIQELNEELAKLKEGA